MATDTESTTETEYLFETPRLTGSLNRGDEIAVRYASAHTDEIQEVSGVVDNSFATGSLVWVRFSDDETEYELRSAHPLTSGLKSVHRRTGMFRAMETENVRKVRVSKDLDPDGAIKSIAVSPFDALDDGEDEDEGVSA